MAGEEEVKTPGKVTKAEAEAAKKKETGDEARGGVPDPGDVSVTTSGNVTLNVASKEALEGMLDSSLIGNALAVGLTKQLDIQFSKTDFFKKLTLGPANAMAGVFKNISQKIETYNISLIDAARGLRRATGGIVTDIEAMRSIGNVREELGGSLAEFGITGEEVIEQIKNVRGQTGEFIRFLSDKETVDGLTTFQTKLAQLDVKLDISKIEGALSDLNNKNGPEAIKRIKEISAVADRLSKVTGVSLNKAFEITFTSAKKLIDSGNISFNNLRKTAAASMGLVSQFGIDVPNTLNKVLPTFTEVNKMSANLSAVTRGFTFDEGAFFNQRGPERLNSIFQALRKAQQAGTFKVEEEGMARDQQVAYLTNAFKVMGMGQKEVTALLRGLQQGEETMLSTAVQPLSAAELDAEVSDRIRESLTREDIREIPIRRGAERAALGAEGDIRSQREAQKRAGTALDEVRSQVDAILKQRGETFNALTDALGKNSITFLKMSEAIKAFSGEDKTVTADGLIAYGLLGPPGTFTKTLSSITRAGEEVDKLFNKLKKRGETTEGKEGINLGEVTQGSPAMRRALEGLKQLLEAEELIREEVARETLKKKEAIEKRNAAREGEGAEESDDETSKAPAIPGKKGAFLDPSKMAPLRVVVVNTKDLAEGFSGMSLMEG